MRTRAIFFIWLSQAFRNEVPILLYFLCPLPTKRYITDVHTNGNCTALHA